MRRSAFTLIELLVVIAIIAILAAILFPVFAQAKLSAKNTQDLSNMKNVSTSALIYMADYDDLYVPVGCSDPWNTTGNITPTTNPAGPAPGIPWMGWGLRLQPYVKNKQIFQSPHLSKRGGFTGTCANNANMELTNTYSMNWMLGRDGCYGGAGDGDYGSAPDGTRLNSPISQTAIEAPSNTVAFLLSNSLPPYGRSWGCIYTTLESSDFINKLRFRAIYRDGGNLSFSDGSARYVRFPEADAANNGPSGLPGSGTGPRLTIYHSTSRQIWMQPTMPGSRMGYLNSAAFGENNTP
jgi:prepilin-type N-terminal cleavage/methylation domain-containing protein